MVEDDSSRLGRRSSSIGDSKGEGVACCAGFFLLQDGVCLCFCKLLHANVGCTKAEIVRTVSNEDTSRCVGLKRLRRPPLSACSPIAMVEPGNVLEVVCQNARYVIVLSSFVIEDVPISYV
jgi:hypothetical protein